MMAKTDESPKSNHELPRTWEDLLAAHRAGRPLEYLLFWGHTPPVDGQVGPHVLSQWWPAAFEVDGERYATAEHFMMAAKARLFDDAEARSRVFAAASPADAKAIGRSVRGFESARWAAHRFELVVTGNVAKFSADPALEQYLLQTGDAIFVEASPRDRIWGIGLGRNNPAATDPTRWRGQNLLGFALVEVRARLRGG